MCKFDEVLHAKNFELIVFNQLTKRGLGAVGYVRILSVVFNSLLPGQLANLPTCQLANVSPNSYHSKYDKRKQARSCHFDHACQRGQPHVVRRCPCDALLRLRDVVEIL